MPKLVLKSELTENVELLTQIAEKLGFEVSVKEEKSKKKEKLKKEKSKKNGLHEFLKKEKSSKVSTDELDEDESTESEDEVVGNEKKSEKLAKVKVKNVGKDKKGSKGYYDLDDDFMKDF